MTRQGKLFVFEGMDSVGKTTLSQCLTKRLNEHGEDTQWLSFPGNTPGTVGAVIYEIHHAPNKFGLGQMTSLANQFLHLAAHVDTLESTILPTLASGVNVVLDRFWWSAIIYGPKDERNRAALLRAIEAEKGLWGKVVPNALFLLTRQAPFDSACRSDGWAEMQREYLAFAADQDSNHAIFVIENAGLFDTTLDSIISRIFPLLRKQ